MFTRREYESYFGKVSEQEGVNDYEFRVSVCLSV